MATLAAAVVVAPARVSLELELVIVAPLQADPRVALAPWVREEVQEGPACTTGAGGSSMSDKSLPSLKVIAAEVVAAVVASVMVALRMEGGTEDIVKEVWKD
jgi:hypothetical protein